MLDLIAESWTWYGLVMLMVFARYISRYITLGSIKKYQPEDYVMMIVACLYTIEIVLLNRVAETPTNLIAPEDLPNLDQADIDTRIYGSKLVVALEQVYCAAIWGCKACLLLMYSNLTFGLGRQHTMVKIVAVYVAITYVVMTVLYLGVWCRPIYNYWSFPTDSPQCSAATNHLITNMVFNVTSDILMLAIPLPVLIKMKLPLRKKIVLVAVFSVGIFVILSAILNKYYSFTYPYGAEWTFWYTREISTAVLVTNIPHCWALLRRFFNLRSFLSGGTHNTASRSASVAPRDTPGSPRERSQRSSMQNAGHTNRAAMADNRWHPRTDSQEFITVPLNMQGQPESNPPRRNLPLEIWQNRVIEVRVDDATDIRRSRAHSLDSSDLESQMPVADIPPDGIHTTITATGR